MKRPKRVWGITGVHSPPVVGGEKPVKDDDIFLHLLAAFAAATSILICSPYTVFLGGLLGEGASHLI